MEETIADTTNALSSTEQFNRDIVPLRTQIDYIDKGLLALLTARASLVREVGDLKKKHGQSLQASGREAGMFAKLKASCKELGLDEGYALELWSLIIWNSKIMECKQAGTRTFMNQNPVPPDILRNNLLTLTRLVAAEYDDYCNGSLTNAIRAYRAREEIALTSLIETADHGLALDLGCATGQMTKYLASAFETVQAYDVSPDMIAEARAQSWGDHVSFHQCDLEEGIPAEDGTVSCVVANFGAASEMGPRFLSEIQRVLKPGGKALLSFYNKDALVNQWFYPWPSTVHIRANPMNDTVEVWANENVFVLQAKCETVTNLTASFQANGLEMVHTETYPTIAAVLPAVFFLEDMFETLVTSVSEIDAHLAPSVSGVNQGAYILAVVSKK